MRGQFRGLKALIDAILTFSSAEVDGVNTLPPGSPAGVSVTVESNTPSAHFHLRRSQIIGHLFFYNAPWKRGFFGGVWVGWFERG